MKSFLKWMSGTIAIILLLALPVTKAQAQYDDDYVSYQTFYDDLSPYGQWVNDPQYGNVWVPDVSNDFRPYYTNGRWAMTDYGNTWVSDYPWGWAPFHYGRWTYNPFYGWVWVPGNTWGPAWVSWRWGGGNCGWAPMAPGISISMSFGNYSCPTDWWVFVGPQYMYQPNFQSYWRGPRYNNTYINQTTIINNTYNNTYVYGPRANQIESVTHQRVNTHRLANGQRGPAVVRNNSINMYRPQVRGSAQEGRPRNVVQAPRSIGSPQGGVRSTRPEFKTLVARGELKPVSGGRINNPRENGVREQRFDARDNNQVRPAPGNRMDRQQTQQPRMDRQPMQQQRMDRQQMQERQPQRMERQPMQQQPQRIDRQQMQQQRVERPQPQRMERQPMQQQRMERPQPQRMERQPMQQQRMERPQPQRMERQPMQQQRMERPQPQRMERQPMQQQRMERPQPQRMERQPMQQQRMERSQPAPRPQPQMQRSEPQRMERAQPQGRSGRDDRFGGRR